MLPAPVIAEEVAEPAPKQPLQDSPKAPSPAPAPALALGGEACGDAEAVQRPEASASAVESSDSEAGDPPAQVTCCACRSGLP